MKISFATSRLEKTFNSERLLRRDLGQRMADIISLRMAVLDAADNLSLVPHEKPIRRHLLIDDRAGQFAVDLVHPNRLIFLPNHDPIPLLPDGGINLAQVTAIQILEIIDYH